MRTRSKKASAFLKHIVSSLASVVKAKSAAVGDKTRAVLKSRIAMTSLVVGRKRKVLQLQLASVCDRITTAFGGSSSHSDDDDGDHRDDDLAMVLYDPNHQGRAEFSSCCWKTNSCCCSCKNEAVEPGALVKTDQCVKYNISNNGNEDCPYYFVESSRPSSSSNGRGEELLNDEAHDHPVRRSNEGDDHDDENIDEVADMFIVKIHKQMRLQKLESFKRYQEMLQRSL